MKFILVLFLSSFISCTLVTNKNDKKSDTQDENTPSSDLTEFTSSELLLKYQRGEISLKDLLEAIAPKLLEDKKLYEEVVKAVQGNQELLNSLKGKDAENLNDDNDNDGFLDITEILTASNSNDPKSKPADENNDLIPDIFQIKGDKGDIGLQGLQGEKGEKGDAGIQGIQGENGDTGLNGFDGKSIIWMGSLINDPLNPEFNWAYYNIEDKIAYIFDGTEWQILAKDGIQGEQGFQGEPGIQGIQGVPGMDGLSIIWKGTLSSTPSNPLLNWAYYNSTDKKSYIYDGNFWTILSQDGATGSQGPQGIQGEQGLKGDTGDVGEKGIDGKSIIWLGSLNTNPLNPELNSAYYNSIDKISYIWDGISWGILSKDGLDGLPGSNGSNGTNGINSLINILNEPSGSNCLNGGKKIQSGIDNGDNAGTANDNILQTGEIDVTKFLCSSNLTIISTPVLSFGTNATYYYNVDSQNSESGSLFYYLLVKPAGMTINKNSGEINWSPSDTIIGNFDVIVIVSDDLGNVSPQSFTIERFDNTAPIFGGLSSLEVLSDSKIKLYWLAGNDNITTSDNLTYKIFKSLSSGAYNLNEIISSNGPSLNYTVSGLSENSNYYFMVKVCDELGNCEINNIEKTQKTFFRDEDSDGAPYEEDSNPTNKFLCHDSDTDGCNECSSGYVASISTDGTDTDSDDICNFSDSDDDNDGLLDIFETNTEIYISGTDTGTNPLMNDTDQDGFSDGAEVIAGTNPLFNLNLLNTPSTPSGQTLCFDNTAIVDCNTIGGIPPVCGNNPAIDFCGQDYQYTDSNAGRLTATNVNGEIYVKDNFTELYWQKAYTTKIWQEAVDYCNALSYAGFTDWRLPTYHELITIIDNGRPYPTYDTTLFDGPSPGSYAPFWTNRKSLENNLDNQAWYVNFFDGSTWYTDKTGSASTRCVRP